MFSFGLKLLWPVSEWSLNAALIKLRHMLLLLRLYKPTPMSGFLDPPFYVVICSMHLFNGYAGIELMF